MGTLDRPRRIVITGASQGIGRATALLLARAGHHVVLAARRDAPLREVAAQIVEHGGQCTVAPVDVTDTTSVESWARTVLEGGAVDVLVNNAGSLDQDLFLSQSDEARRDEMELNYFGALRATQALLPSLLRQGSGAIVNVSSMLGSVGSPTTANYCASKAALEAFSHGLRGEVAHRGVRVTVFVAPHAQTALGNRAEFEGLKSVAPEVVAVELMRAIDCAPRRHAAGSHLRMGLRLAAWFPRHMEQRIAKMVSGKVHATP